MWRRRFLQYLADPWREWPEGRKHQADKLRVRSRQDARTVISLARRRFRYQPTTLFVINCGSSGSHWLTAMLGVLPNVVDCGEVYLPPGLLAEMDSWSVRERSYMVDSIHLAHSPRLDPAVERAVLINSAHGSGWRIAQAHGAPVKRILLIRDPLQIVLSRTLRKPDHKKIVARDFSDEAFLETNIEFVRSFFDRAAANPCDLCVRYEDMRADPRAVLESVCVMVGLDVSDADLSGAVVAHGVDSATTNIYQGPREEVPWHLMDRASEVLHPLRESLGYAPTSDFSKDGQDSELLSSNLHKGGCARKEG